MKIIAKEITAENFRKFGGVVKAPSNIPTSQSPEYKFWSDIASYYIEGETEIGICTVYKQNENNISGMERHINTPEILIPIDKPFVLPLLKEGQEETEMEAFKVGIGEAVVIDKSVWHGACLPVQAEESSYFVIFRKGTPHNDVEKKNVKVTKLEY